MPAKESWLRVFEAFKETANLVAGAILLVAFFLTLDWTAKRADFVLLAAGLALELIYLVSASQSTHYERRLRTRATRNPRGVLFLDRLLFVVTVSGVVVILFFGFGKHLMSHPLPYLTHAGGWEAGAIIWTGLFLIYYLAKFEFTGKPGLDKVIILGLFLAGWQLSILAWHSMTSPVEHVWYILLIALCFLTIDSLLAWKHPVITERPLSRASLFWADAPMVTSFVVLLFYLWIHDDTEAPEVFVSGVVSCQLVISNVVFVVMEFGWLRSPDTDASDPAKDTSTVAAAAGPVLAPSSSTDLTNPGAKPSEHVAHVSGRTG